MVNYPEIQISGRKIGQAHSPYIIAEVSANHRGNLKEAIRHIVAAKAVGADIVKFQAYTPDTITIDSDKPPFQIKDGPWAGRTLYDLYKEAYTPFEWFPTLFKVAADIGIPVFASVFDNTSVDMLEGLGCPAYKIASFELCDIPLIQYAAQTEKPMILSTGMATNEVVAAADDAIDLSVQRALLHCVSGYPTPAHEANLHRIKYLQNYAIPVGFSDHTLGTHLAVAAVALGASIIEKHFILDRAAGGVDAQFSLEPEEFRRLVLAVRETHEALQSVPASSEASSRPFQRSIYVVKEIAPGELFSPENVRSIRPGGGLPPAHLPQIYGKASRLSLSAGDPISWDAFQESALPEDGSQVREQVV